MVYDVSLSDLEAVESLLLSVGTDVIKECEARMSSVLLTIALSRSAQTCNSEVYV